MNFDYSEEQQMIKNMVHDFAENEVKPLASEIDRKDEFPWGIYRKMGELGILAMSLPPEYGGSGADTVSWSITEEELAKASATVADSQLLTKLMSDMILRHGREEQKNTYLKAMGKGELICATCITEPDTGSDVASIRTTAKSDGDHYIVKGTKAFITCGAIADMGIVLSRTDETKGTRGMSSIIVEKKIPGFSVGKKEDLMGMRGLETSQLIFEDCRVPKDNLLGNEGEGFKYSMISLDMGRIGIGSQALGLAQAAMEQAIAYAKERVVFGKSVADFQSIQFMFADISCQIAAARLLLHKAAFLSDQGRRFSLEASQAKLFASEVAVRVARDALQVHGGYGYTKEFAIERIYRDVKLYQIWEGTSQIQKLVISRYLLQ